MSSLAEMCVAKWLRARGLVEEERKVRAPLRYPEGSEEEQLVSKALIDLFEWGYSEGYDRGFQEGLHTTPRMSME